MSLDSLSGYSLDGKTSVLNSYCYDILSAEAKAKLHPETVVAVVSSEDFLDNELNNFYRYASKLNDSFMSSGLIVDEFEYTYSNPNIDCVYYDSSLSRFNSGKLKSVNISKDGSSFDFKIGRVSNNIVQLSPELEFEYESKADLIDEAHMCSVDTAVLSEKAKLNSWLDSYVQDIDHSDSKSNLEFGM